MVAVGSIRGKADLRKHARKPFHWRATILAGGEQSRPCTVTDVSESGARLRVDKPNELPEKFTLLLSSMGQARRLCRVIWRSRKEAGVKFLAE